MDHLTTMLSFLASQRTLPVIAGALVSYAQLSVDVSLIRWII